MVKMLKYNCKHYVTVREHRKDNQECTILIQLQHWAKTTPPHPLQKKNHIQETKKSNTDQKLAKGKQWQFLYI